MNKNNVVPKYKDGQLVAVTVSDIGEPVKEVIEPIIRVSCISDTGVVWYFVKHFIYEVCEYNIRKI